MVAECAANFIRAHSVLKEPHGLERTLSMLLVLCTLSTLTAQHLNLLLELSLLLLLLLMSHALVTLSPL